MSTRPQIPVETVAAAAYEIPTDLPESDGTLAWDSTVLVTVTVTAGGRRGVGYTYAAAACAALIRDVLAPIVVGANARTPSATWATMLPAIRNLGVTGLAAMAVSAVDIALWDLHARLAELPVSTALGAVHPAVPIYGSGGFCAYTDAQLAAQLSGWADAGIGRVKMKVGRDPDQDRRRLDVAREAIGAETSLMVDANGAYSRTQALRWAEVFADHGVVWLEEPVSSDDLDGLRMICARAPSGMDIAAGEYGFSLPYFHRMLAAGAVDCLQSDPTRCLGFTGLLRVAALCDARSLELSLHCAPQVSAHAGAAVWHLRHLEYFHDHVRIERLAFDGVLAPGGGTLRPDPSVPGLGLTLKEADLDVYRVG